MIKNTYYTVYIPSEGKPEIRECDEYVDYNGGFEMSLGNIGINSTKGIRMRVVVKGEWDDIVDKNRVPAFIYGIDEFPRDKYTGLSLDDAIYVFNQLINRKYVLWNAPSLDDLRREFPMYDRPVESDEEVKEGNDISLFF